MSVPPEQRGATVVCRVCGGVAVAFVEPSSSGSLRYRCTDCQAEWLADEPQIGRGHGRGVAVADTNEKDRRTLTDRRTAQPDRRGTVADRRGTDRRGAARREANASTGVTRAEYENLVGVTEQNARAIRRIEDQLRQLVDHLRLDLAPESHLKSRAS